MENLSRIPTDGVPAGKIVVHNHVIPAAPLGNYGFRAWLRPEKGAENVEICPCQWAPGIGPHYRVKGSTTEPDEVIAAREVRHGEEWPCAWPGCEEASAKDLWADDGFDFHDGFLFCEEHITEARKSRHCSEDTCERGTKGPDLKPGWSEDNLGYALCPAHTAAQGQKT